ncbi:TetR/AcrR family transcriptional regulator [Actinokineospora iranica]|uniref:Regulatory protein, tetR family n=1 Tax=Actinokineospora iranica TaxID=1271860 RepID=A0A1G6TYQ8_9PSEU|nr:TetR/AcrR family transcriptional regulator [Actinokineospora iranica]SDD34218.1 regulatory protein, tetR family [Actinokineospora iranica]
MRADARRNRERLLAAARKVFDERGIDAALDEVARRAGIGNATLYRHFPTRRDLIVAVYADEVADLCGRGEALLAADSPGAALAEWLRLFVSHVAAKRELALAIEGERSALFEQWHRAVSDTAAALLARARRDGAARDDVDVADLVALATGIAVVDPGGERTEALLSLVRLGLAPR